MFHRLLASEEPFKIGMRELKQPFTTTTTMYLCDNSGSSEPSEVDFLLVGLLDQPFHVTPAGLMGGLLALAWVENILSIF